jgi:hypothetical protein
MPSTDYKSSGGFTIDEGGQASSHTMLLALCMIDVTAGDGW